jgi:glycosyltransferase involved in cell wall biosynthesis
MVGWGVVKEEKTRRIYGSGVDLDHYTTAPLTRHPPRILFVGRLLRNKGIFEFVEAIRILKQEHSEVEVRIVGETLDHPSLVPPEKVKGWVQEGLVEHMGWADDVRPYLAWCNLFVLPSYREGTPRSVLEALATGRPVITTDVPGCREVVRHGENGLLVPPRDPTSLAMAMRELVEDPEKREAFAAAGLVLARDLYDVRKVNRDILEGMGLIGSSP